jgi:hypothetical protein
MTILSLSGLGSEQSAAGSVTVEGAAWAGGPAAAGGPAT